MIFFNIVSILFLVFVLIVSIFAGYYNIKAIMGDIPEFSSDSDPKIELIGCFIAFCCAIGIIIMIINSH